MLPVVVAVLAVVVMVSLFVLAHSPMAAASSLMLLGANTAVEDTAIENQGFSAR